MTLAALATGSISAHLTVNTFASAPVAHILAPSITAVTSASKRDVQPFQASPTTSCCDPDVVVIHLETSLTVSNFHRIYREDIHSFEPKFVITPDGSLISSPLAKDLKAVAENLLLLGAYMVLFLWNALAAIGFILRTSLKDKSIFHILFASQALALVPWVVLTIGVFTPSLSCSTIYRTTEIFIYAAISLVLTGVFGIKAYRCLFNSRIVAIGLVIFQVAHTGLVIFRVVTMRPFRQIIGTCSDSNNSGFTPITLGVIVVEAVFIAVCFLYAVWRSSRILAAQGRLSFRESLGDDPLSPHELAPSFRYAQSTYTSRDHPPPPALTRTRAVDHTPASSNGLPSVPTLQSSEQARATPRKPKLVDRDSGRYGRVMKFVLRCLQKLKVKAGTIKAMTQRQSLLLASLKPRMELFREVMRDELCYTTVMAAASVVSAIFALIATCRHMWISEQGWISFHLAVMSALAVHSLHRVVRRNENEALLQDPRFWDPMRRAARVGSRFDSLSLSDSSSDFILRSAHPGDGSPVRLADRRGRHSWQWDTRLSQGNSHVAHSRDSVCSAISGGDAGDCELAVRRASYGSVSSQSVHSEDCLIPPRSDTRASNPKESSRWPTPFM